MLNRFARNTVLAGAALALVLGTGCEEPNWEDPAYISKQLSEGDALSKRQAIEALGRLPAEKQTEAVPGLIAVYKAAGPNQKDAMGMLVQLRDERAKDVYLEELKTNVAGFSGAAGAALGEIKATDAIPAMLELLKTTDSPDAKIGIIQSFKFMPDKQLVAPLADILKLDPDNHPIALHAYSCEVLGEIALAVPDAIDDAALQQLTLSMFYANNKNQNVAGECGLAVQQVGPRATPELIKILKGEREDVTKLMLKYDTPQSPFPANHPKIMATQRLASLRAKEAQPIFMADLEKVKEAPKSLAGNAAVNWRVKEGQLTSEEIYALGDLGDPASSELLQKVLKNDSSIQKNWDDITDGMVELQLRQDSASALNRLGDRAALPALLDMAENGVVIDFEKRAAILEGKGAPVKELERYQFNWIVAQEYANLAQGKDLEAYRAMVKRVSEKYKELGTKLGSFVPMIEVAAECEKAGDDAAKGKCFAGKLKDPKPEIRAKAAWELSRLPAAVSGPILIENLGTDFLDTREIITFGLYRAPSKEGAAAIQALLEKEVSKTTVPYKLDHRRLRLLHAYMVHASK